MSKTRSVNGALAIIKINGIALGLVQSINATEQYTRTNVGQIGSIYTKERPITGFLGTGSCNSLLLDYNDDLLTKIPNKLVQTPGDFELSALFAGGFTLDVFERVSDAIDATTGLPVENLAPIAIIQDCHIDQQGFTIQQGNNAFKNVSFTFLTPIIRPS